MPVAKPYLLLDDVNSELDYPLLAHEDMDSDEEVLVHPVCVDSATPMNTTDFGETTFSTTHKLTGTNGDSQNDRKSVPTNDAVTNSQGSNTTPSGEVSVQLVVPQDMQRQISEEEVTFFSRYNVETEETMKCIVTSVMFIVIIITIIIVAVIVNPQV